MAKADEAHEWTEEELAELEKRIAAEYKKAAKELQEKIDDYFQKFAARDEAMRKRVESEEITKDYYQQWRLAQMGRGERFEALRDRVAERMTKANEVAAAYINDATPGLYSLNRNYAAYTIEQVAGDVGFDLWDEQTVKRLIKEQPDLMPYYPPERAVRRGFDLDAGKKMISTQMTSGIIQGESIKELADRLQSNTQTMNRMNRNSAIRAARTAVTGAQNAGRMDSYDAAGKMGIKLKKEWLATLDGRTRHSHAVLDGEQVENDKKFSNGCMFPGDPNGPPSEIYNCRCTLIAAVDGVDTSDAKRRARDPETGETKVIEDMTYSEWAEWKESLQDKKTHGIIEEREQLVYKKFETGDEVNDFFYFDGDKRGILAMKTSEYGQWERSLTQQQRIVIGDYCADAYADINSYWRKYGDWQDIDANKVLSQTEALDKAIESYNLKDNITVYRAVEPEAFQDYWDDIQRLVGSTYTDPAFMSTSPFKGSSAVNKDCIMELDIPAGTGRGAYINRISGFQDEEYEFLLARGSKFTVKSVEETENQLILRMEMIV